MSLYLVSTAATKLELGDHWLNNHRAIFIEARSTDPIFHYLRIHHLYNEDIFFPGSVLRIRICGGQKVGNIGRNKDISSQNRGAGDRSGLNSPGRIQTE